MCEDEGDPAEGGDDGGGGDVEGGFSRGRGLGGGAAFIAAGGCFLRWGEGGCSCSGDDEEDTDSRDGGDEPVAMAAEAFSDGENGERDDQYSHERVRCWVCPDATEGREGK